ncbi:hypothetical protein OHA91_22925 [Streptomyces erythrochromogenes]|uniref:Uncharacterized protein n=1 Tax=Streptomyces erythrochromogenes TaxID=285574 RepID=A0ABZ1QEL4_9ACTN|nr:hypothetical protein [Streptomyces erythrochromogenes]
MPDEQPDKTWNNSVPHDFRNALYWRWAKEIPRPLRGGFLTLLYAMASAANTAGVLRMRDGTVIRVQSIARGCASDIKEVRRWLAAAEAAGVVGVQGERVRGIPTVYTILIAPRPDWAAAVASLTASRRVRPKKAAAPWSEEEQNLGGPAPQAEDPSWGDRPPNFADESLGDRPPNPKGGPAPLGLGGPAPQGPRGSHVLPQETAAVGGHPSLGGAPPGDSDPPNADPPPDTDRPPLALTTQERRDRRAAEVKAKSASSQGQMPLLLSVRAPEHVATVAEVRAAAETDPEAVLRAIRTLGRREAIRVYGWRLVSPHITDFTDTDTA